MTRFRHDPGCERTREWASLELDGELSQIERVLLRAHLRRCAECADVVAELRALTRTLRAAPLERPELRVAVPVRRAPPRRRLAFRLAFAVSLAGAAAAFGVFVGALPRAHSQKPPPQGEIALLSGPRADREIKALRASEELKAPLERVNPPGRIGGNV
jgi:anti-sigma factor RsiW